jgi:hypothetical protein
LCRDAERHHEEDEEQENDIDHRCQLHLDFFAASGFEFHCHSAIPICDVLESIFDLPESRTLILREDHLRSVFLSSQRKLFKTDLLAFLDQLLDQTACRSLVGADDDIRVFGPKPLRF